MNDDSYSRTEVFLTGDFLRDDFLRTFMTLCSGDGLRAVI